MQLASAKEQLESLIWPSEQDALLRESGTRMADEFCGSKGKKEPRPKTKTINNSTFKRICAEMTEFTKSADWTDATSTHFVALYAFMHLRIYGVECIELGPTDRLRAAGMAARKLKTHFDNDGNEMASFMRWVWTREKVREQWRRDNNAEGGRIGWNFQFNGRLLTDYRLGLARVKSQSTR